MPMPTRLLTSLAIRLEGNIYLFDAGEGTQLGLKQAHLGVRGLTLLAVTHLHADHCLGIPGLLMLRAQLENPGPLTVLGPPGIEEFVRQNRKLLEFHLNFPLHFIEWSQNCPEPAYQDDRVRIFWHPLRHTRFCLGYRLEESARPGKFDPRQARKLHVPQGPLWSKLQRGEAVTSTDGRSILPEQVLGPPRRGRHIAYVVDTRPAKGIYRLCQNVDLAFLEGMFSPEHAEHAAAKGHLTVDDAARIAGRAGVHKAVLVHISPRYDEAALEQLQTAAQKRFQEVVIGRDQQIHSIAYAD